MRDERDRRTRVAVVSGGPSAEAEVSRSSGRGVAAALCARFAHVIALELDAGIADALRRHAIDVVFPALHGPPGEDGTFQGLLEMMRIPYVGSGVHASAYAMDKIIAKHCFRLAGLPVARDLVVRRGEGTRSAARRVLETLGADVVVKPARQGSALGIRFAAGGRELEAALEGAFAYDDGVLVEERIAGREVTVALLERDGVEALPAIEVRTPVGAWYDYEHRYTPGASEHVIPAGIADGQYRRVREVARHAHEALGCRDLSRADFVVPAAGEPVLLEVNTLPGMTPTSLYPDAARAAGISFEALAAHLVGRALARA